MPSVPTEERCGPQLRIPATTTESPLSAAWRGAWFLILWPLEAVSAKDEVRRGRVSLLLACWPDTGQNDPGQTDSQSRAVYQAMFRELHGTDAFCSGNNHRRGNQPYLVD